MIDFPCHCGHKFSVAVDMAGGMIQCTQCGRLNDVPLLSDLGHIAEDGTYTLELLPEKKDDPEVVAELQRLYGKSRVDEDGTEIDLRQTVEEVYEDAEEDAAAQGEIGIAGEAAPGSPKYDPITGELIETVEVKEPKAPAAVTPLPKPALAYAHAEFAVQNTPLRVLVGLCQPINVFVMFVVFMLHVFALLVCTNWLSIILLLWLPPLIFFVLVAHYGNIVDDVGPNLRDELPTPTRGVSWHDDLWGPFRDVMIAMTFCYGPAFLTAFNYPLQKPIVLALVLSLAAIGTVAAPAMLLTTLTSGTVINARPDRLLGVMGKCGLHYVALLLLWVATVASNFWGMLIGLSIALQVTGVIELSRAARSNPLFNPLLGLGLLIGGIFLMHYFCWYLGMMYRLHHADFPWVLQRHVGKPRDATRGFPVIRRKRAHRLRGGGGVQRSPR